MADNREAIGNQIESLALALVTLEDDDIPAMGQMLNQLAEIGELSKETMPEPFADLIKALEGYLETIVLRDAHDLHPFETGIENLQRYFHAICNETESSIDLIAILSDLGVETGAMADTLPQLAGLLRPPAPSTDDIAKEIPQSSCGDRATPRIDPAERTRAKTQARGG